MSAVKLHGLERSVYTRIARLALEEKGVPYSLVEVEIFGPDGVPPEHVDRHPFGRIPVLENNGFQLYETTAITRFVDEAFSGPSLQPSEPHARARMNQVISIIDSYAYRPMVWGVFVERVRIPLTGGKSDEARITKASVAAKICLSALVALAECKPFLVSSQLTLADLHAFPILHYFSLAAEGRQVLAAHPALKRWHDTMQLRESVRKTASEYEAPS